ncbi:M3 family oligoendopeptidase [Thermophilibacter sp. ET337]|uniref:M3 family oligoendopeptidase n=1 Tax=Thermophilibacter sp. ET337 TaxID=2973084 RepID=UPI0021AC0F02|nr:M3 family oligoendopeptidase [Thermophilibacter sp. ET337]MCR8908097.1 M3 family oligoendopeptidase [Thermophilibacter sp. ET337]
MTEPVKFKDMPYERPDLEAVKAEYARLAQALADAETPEAADAVFLEKDQLDRHTQTAAELAMIRHVIDTRDEFYDAEASFWDEAQPELQQASDAFTAALLASPFRPQLEERYGTLLFAQAEQERRTIDPAIVEDMKRENALAQEYVKLIASAQIPFEGGTYTLSQLTPFKKSADDAQRLAAWKAEGAWYKEHQADFDRIYDELTHVRDAMGRKRGYKNYLPLGYDRMGRLSYGREDVERFREAVRTYVVPLADKIYRAQGSRLGVEYPLSFADEALSFRSGNPAPRGGADDILEAGRTFYRALSPETGEFFDMMLDRDLMDVLSTEGKAGGGFMTQIPDYDVPFIFANFNGTQGDVEVVTHEAGHAFSYYMNTHVVPITLSMPSMEACEVHSMSMEFMAWPWAEEFFGDDARKYRYAHLAGAITFIPYGTMVDHFQHEVYEHPEMTPAERHATWKRLLGVYMPWMRLDGEIPFYADGEGWQRQHHIYENPLYYIDYCLAQTVSLEFWAMSQDDFANAWEHYMAYTRQGGTRAFTDLLAHAGMTSPFDEGCLKAICERATAWLDSYDLTGIA